MEDEWDDDVLHAEVQMLEARHASSAKAAKTRDKVSASLATKAKRRKTQEPQGPGADGGVTVQTVAASIPAPLSLPMPPGGVIRVGTVFWYGIRVNGIEEPWYSWSLQFGVLL